MFFEEEPPKRLGHVEGADLDIRAGTKLDHRWAEQISIDGKVHGLYDQSQRVYQTGGVFTKFVYWKEKKVSLDLRVWREIIDKVDWIEIIDHEKNECLRIAGEKARKHASIYNAGIGDRIGIPIEHWTWYDASGRRKK